MSSPVRVNMPRTIRHSLLMLAAFGLAMMHDAEGWGQCGSLLDSDGVPVESPIYSECNDGSGTFTFFPLTNGSWTDVTVDWGTEVLLNFLPSGTSLSAISHDTLTNLWPPMR